MRFDQLQINGSIKENNNKIRINGEVEYIYRSIAGNINFTIEGQRIHEMPYHGILA